MYKDYKINHAKKVEIARKLKDLRIIILPPINTIVNIVNSSKRYNSNNRNSENNYSYGNSISKDVENLHQERKQSLNPELKIQNKNY